MMIFSHQCMLIKIKIIPEDKHIKQFNQPQQLCKYNQYKIGMDNKFSESKLQLYIQMEEKK